jgi:hypothetical protein
MANVPDPHRRVELSTTIDADLLDEVDRFVAEHPGASRQSVLDEALRLWAAQRRARAIEAQHSGEADDQDAAEQAAWREIRRAAAARLFREE